MDEEKAIQNFEGATCGDAFGFQFSPVACLELGRIYTRQRKHKRAVKMLEKACSGIDFMPEARYLLGCCYARGRGVRKNIKKAIALMEEAAQDSHSRKRAKQLQRLRNERQAEIDNKLVRDLC